MQPPPPSMSGGLAPAVANLFQSHATATQPQQQPQPQQQYGGPPMPMPMHPTPQYMQPPHPNEGGYPGPAFGPGPHQLMQQPHPGMNLNGPPPPFPFPHQPPPHMQQQMQPPHPGFAPPPPQLLHQQQPPQFSQFGGPPPQQQMHPHVQQPQPQFLPHPSHHGYLNTPPTPAAPPPSRQVSELAMLPPAQVAGPGSMLSTTPALEEDHTVPVVGVVLAREDVLEADPWAKQLGGDEHAATPCTEFSSIPRKESNTGCLIAHADDFTIFALKQGLARLVYHPSEDNKQMEVMKGHTAPIIDIAFLPVQGDSENTTITSTSRHAATLSEKELIIWSCKVSDDNAVVQEVARLPGESFTRLRFQPVACRYLAVLSETSLKFSLLDIADVLSNGVSDSAWKSISVSSDPLVDATWSEDGRSMILTSEGRFYEYELSRDHVTKWAQAFGLNERVLSVPNSPRRNLVLMASNHLTYLQLWDCKRQSPVSAVSIRSKNIECTGIDIDPTGSCVFVTYRRLESSGEVSDQGMFVFHLSIGEFDDTIKEFDFVTVFFQPDPILSFSIVQAKSTGSDSRTTLPDLDVYAVETKPIVKLHIGGKTLIRPFTADEIRFRKSRDPNRSLGGFEKDDEDEHHHEAIDAVHPLRSTLPKLLVAQDAISDSSPPLSFVNGSILLGTSSGPNSASSSAANSRIQSPAVVSFRDRPEFQPLDQPLDTTNMTDVHSGRESPATTSSPLKHLRPRGNSTDSRVQFNLSASAQPTPAPTPIPGTPNQAQHMFRSSSNGSVPSGPSSEVNSRSPSPLPSPHAGGSFQGQSVATTAENSTVQSQVQSPLISSPSSPMISPSPTPNPMDASGIESIPSTPMHIATNSSTTTPAPTPLALTKPSQRLSQMSTADVSLHFLSATAVGQDSSRLAGAGSGASTLTPMNTPASSVPSTPRFGATAPPNRKNSLTSTGVVSQASLRVRTSGSTSPSPISSPLLHPHTGYIKHRSASMDRESFNRLNGVDLVEEEDETATSTPQQQPRPERESRSVSTPTAATAAAPSSGSKEKQEQTLLYKLDQLFAKHYGKVSVLVQKERMEQQTADQQRFDTLTQELVATINERIETGITEIVQDTLLPSIEQSVTHAVTTAVGSGSGVGSGNTDALSSAILAGLQDNFRTAFTQTLIPSFQQSIQRMLTQIQTSVAAATAASSATTASPVKDDQAARDAKRKEAEAAAREKARDQQMGEMMKILTNLAQAQVQTQTSTNALVQQVAELAKAQAQLAARPTLIVPTASPTSVTPATPTTLNIRDEVASLLAKEQFDAAFTKALSSGKLETVLFACAQVDPRTLLPTTVPAHKLSPPVILSLIQQLAFDLSTAPSESSQLKLKLLWLREACMVLTVNDVSLRGHAQQVLLALLTKLDSPPLSELPPSHELYDQIRMVRMIVKTKL